MTQRPTSARPHEKTIGILIAHHAVNRVPGRVFASLLETSALDNLLACLKQADVFDEIWLATTRQESDQALQLWGVQQDLYVSACPEDVVDAASRITTVLSKSKATQFMVFFGNEPFVSPDLIRQMLEAMDEHPEWEALQVEKTDSLGVSSPLCYRTAGWLKLEQALSENPNLNLMEWLLQPAPDRLCVGNIPYPLYAEAWPHPLSIVSEADLEWFKSLLEQAGQSGEPVTLENALRFLKEHPELMQKSSPEQVSVHDGPLQVLLAVEAGESYGMGHLQRCKTLAHALKQTALAEATFWVDTSHPTLREELLQEGLNVIQGNWSLPEAIHQNEYHRLVIDFESPLRPTLVERIRIANPMLPIIALDNYGIGCNEVDAIILPNIHLQPNPEWSLESKAFYQGPRYILLGYEFLYGESEFPETALPDRPSILIVMGGRDLEMNSERVLHALKDLKECHIDLIVPSSYPLPENLEKIATRLPSTITLHWRAKNLRPLMQRATLAIAAFGISMYELAYLGVPTLLLCHYSNQVEEIEQFAQTGAAINLGWGKELDADRLQALVSNLLRDPRRRQLMAQKGKALVDPNGPIRVAEVVLSMQRASLSTVRQS